jgi:cytolysin (calcineurin-like family phosphatase)
MDMDFIMDMVFMSDPQLGQKDNKGDVCARNVDHAKSVSTSINNGRCNGVIIVGDLTEFGHGGQLDDYKKLYDFTPYFPALGNHDYDNNVDDCTNNGCAIQMVEYLIDSIKSKDPVYKIRFDMNRYVTDKKETIKGSLAYSFDINGIHFVHLNNYPQYTKSWSNNKKSKNVEITDSIYWLKSDLTQAQGEKKPIIVMVHQGQGEHIVDLGWLADYHISAIFCGHFHIDKNHNAGDGLYGTGGVYACGAPVYNCGSAQKNEYLYARFYKDTIYVDVIDSRTGGTGIKKVASNAVLKWG